MLKRPNDGWDRTLVKPQQNSLRRGSGQNFIQKDIQHEIGCNFQAVGGLPHLTDSLRELAEVLGAIVRMQTECHLQLVNRNARYTRDQCVVQALERPMKPFEALD